MVAAEPFPSLTVWWLPDALTEWVFIARGKRGVCYSVPRVANGWLVRVRWPDGAAPTCPPLPADVARVVGGWLGLPGCEKPSARAVAELGDWLAAGRLYADRTVQGVTP